MKFSFLRGPIQMTILFKFQNGLLLGTLYSPYGKSRHMITIFTKMPQLI